MIELTHHLGRAGNRLCLGLDLDPERFPARFGASAVGLFELGRELVDATIDQVAAYKPNAAFFEQFGFRGMESLEKLIQHIGDRAFVVLDAKRGDIGNTSQRYARAAFEQLHAHAITLAPYMGRDSIEPFLAVNQKSSAFVLALTSNPGSADLQLVKMADGRPLYEHTLDLLDNWNADWAGGRLGAVVGATHPEELARIRQLHPDLPLLIPGVGAQGGSATDVTRILGSGGAPSLVNVSRGILLGSDEEILPESAALRASDFARQLAVEAV
jgi:orotidine-5'-phosphate decarboxylase